MSGLHLLILAVVALFWTHERLHRLDITGSRRQLVAGLIGGVVGYALLIASAVRG